MCVRIFCLKSGPALRANAIRVTYERRLSGGEVQMAHARYVMRVDCVCLIF